MGYQMSGRVVAALRLPSLIAAFLLLLIPVVFPLYTSAQDRGRGTFRTREPNLYAPQLYVDRLRLKMTLVDLPGASDPRSSWEVSYQVFFVPEGKYYEALRQLPEGGSNPRPAQFPGRMLLAEGQLKKNKLGTIQERTSVRGDIAFKAKVPDEQRTKFARLITSYSVKIFDAKLNTPVYHTGIFTTFPFDDSTGASNAVPRDTIYLNFIITPQGQLNRSQWARKDGDTNW
ncbi:MAG TPA: hypothetical protein VJT09_14105 [Pyrinomonadaceae bacterium]|nr:hypothetical protein [Pyrinomonadaceae bacterium]